MSLIKVNSNPSFLVLVLVSVLLFLGCSKKVIEIEDIVDVREEQLLSEGYVISHRGFWNNENSPQNSMAAFERALAMKIYGVEFDVRQTKDGNLVICHDAVFNGLSIENSTSDELLMQKLSNGETLPSLEDFLSTRKRTETKVKLIIDIKNCNINDLVQLINSYELQSEVVYITFTKSYCQQLVNMGYGVNTYYSSNTITPEEIKDMGFGGVCYKYTFLDTNTGVIDAAKLLGVNIMVWTVNNSESIRNYSSMGVYVITDTPEEF